MLPDMPKSKQALFSSFPFLLHLMFWTNTRVFFAEGLCFCAVISSRACSSAWLERIPDKDEAGGSSPPRPTSGTLESGGLAQLVERLLCKQEVSGSTPLSSTRFGCLVHGVMSGVSGRMPGLLFYSIVFRQ